MKVGPLLKKIRNSRRVSRRQLSEGIDVSESTIKYIENEKITSPGVDVVSKILEYFGYALVIAVIPDFLEINDPTKNKNRPRVKIEEEGYDARVR